MFISGFCFRFLYLLILHLLFDNYLADMWYFVRHYDASIYETRHPLFSIQFVIIKSNSDGKKRPVIFTRRTTSGTAQVDPTGSISESRHLASGGPTLSLHPITSPGTLYGGYH